LLAVAVVTWILFYVGRTYGHHGTSTTARLLEFLGMTWMGMLFIATVCLLAVEVVTLFGFAFKRRAPGLRGLALVTALVLSVVALVQGLRPPVVEAYEIYLAGLPKNLDGTVVLAMSDLHIGSQLGIGWLHARVDQVASERPDMVVLLGDILEGHDEAEDELVAELSRFSAPLGVWAVTGNHESYGRSQRRTALLEAGGIRLLRNAWVQPASGLVLAGVDDLTAAHRRNAGDDPIAQALSGRPAAPTILLSHTPWRAEQAAAYGVGLMLSGHTHGGQIWPLGYLIRLQHPLFSGRYQIGRMAILVSRGAGTWGPRMRLWRPGQILRITLRTKKGACP
jgi:predicted MPP superfamily phosphohydrolase